MRGLYHTLHLGVELLQTLNEAEELGNGRRVAPVRREKVRNDEGKHAEAANMTRLQSSSSEDRIMARRILTAIRKESANARRPSNFCARRGASAPPRVDALTNPWCDSQGMTPPPTCAIRLNGGFKQDHDFDKCEQVEGGTEMSPTYRDLATG